MIALRFLKPSTSWKLKDKIPKQTTNIPSNSKFYNTTPSKIKDTIATKIGAVPRAIG